MYLQCRIELFGLYKILAVKTNMRKQAFSLAKIRPLRIWSNILLERRSDFKCPICSFFSLQWWLKASKNCNQILLIIFKRLEHWPLCRWLNPLLPSICFPQQPWWAPQTLCSSLAIFLSFYKASKDSKSPTGCSLSPFLQPSSTIFLTQKLDPSTLMAGPSR